MLSLPLSVYHYARADTNTHTYMHAGTRTGKHVYTITQGIIFHALAISQHWKKAWIKDGCCALHGAFKLHQAASNKSFSLHTLLRAHVRTEDALGWWSHLSSVSERVQWSIGLWDEKERGEDSCRSAESDSNQFEGRYTALLWKSRLLHPCIKWQLILPRKTCLRSQSASALL